MDPISAAGIGLSVASLVLQVFAGCVKGYELFVDATGVPQSYQHLRTRLRIEQARLLNWGQSVGLVEELLERPSQVLQINRNLILDILLEIQATFKSCIEIDEKYDSFVPQDPAGNGTTLGPKPASFLKRTLAILDKQPRVVSRLQWAVIKQSKFEGLIIKLIVFNDRIESLLDRSSMDRLHLMQQQTHMVMLQLTEQVGELRTLSQAMLIKGTKPLSQPEPGLSRSSTLVAQPASEDDLFAGLAAFKAQSDVLAKHPTNLMLPYEKLLQIASVTESRVFGSFEGEAVFLEWRENIEDPRPQSQIDQIVKERVQQLVSLLKSPLKPSAFRAPYCVGYVCDETSEPSRYGLVYDISETFGNPQRKQDSLKPVHHQWKGPLSLRTRMKTANVPSLTKRISLVKSLASALMYLHSVNWLHKAFRSDSVLLPSWGEDGKDKSVTVDLGAPVVSGFDYSRPDLPEEVTLQNPSKIEYDLYRHPDLLQMDHKSRAQKSYDIYSLGIVLLEIAHWKPIESIMDIKLEQKTTRAMVGKIRDRLINDPRFKEAAEGAVGEIYTAVTWKCIEGGWIGKKDVESSAIVGAEMQRIFFEDVWRPLEEIRL